MAATRGDFMFRRSKGFAGCIPTCTGSPRLVGGRNPFAFGKSSLEKQTNTEITAGRCLFCLNSSCSGQFNNTEILAAKPLPSPSSHHKASSSSVNRIQVGKGPRLENKPTVSFFFFFVIVFGFFLQRECCFESMDPSLEHWCWHKAGHHPMVLEVEGLH